MAVDRNKNINWEYKSKILRKKVQLWFFCALLFRAHQSTDNVNTIKMAK